MPIYEAAPDGIRIVTRLMDTGRQSGTGREWSASDGAPSSGILDAFFLTRRAHVEHPDRCVSSQAQPCLIARISESFRSNFISRVQPVPGPDTTAQS